MKLDDDEMIFWRFLGWDATIHSSFNDLFKNDFYFSIFCFFQ